VQRCGALVSLATAAALVFANVPAQAQKAPPIVRDAEIEQLLREYTQRSCASRPCKTERAGRYYQ
jgi:hypothetical protein